MMKRVIVKTEAGMHILIADTMTLHGDMLYIYNGDVLIGMFREVDVRAAYMTEQKVEGA